MRVLDAGQCNDSYSLVGIDIKLQEVFRLDDINKLPTFYNIAWNEQKAFIGLLHLGVKNIHLCYENAIGYVLDGKLHGKVVIEEHGKDIVLNIADNLKIEYMI